jgi:quinoprotein glucose dehydrogenase
MRLPLAFRVSLLAACLATAPFIRAADVAPADDDDDLPSAAGKLRDIGKRKAGAEIAPASDEAAQALKRMKVAPGLEMKLWAAEPMLANPVAFNFDEKGRIFVAETYRYRSSTLDIRDYMWLLEDELATRTLDERVSVLNRRFGPEGLKELAIESEVLRLVEDTDGDGIADKSSVYADGFNSALDGIASGVLARRGKVWFTNIPSVWQFTGAQKAETKTELSRGYGIRFNFTGHDLHGLVWGPDGKIYYSNGDRGSHIVTKEGKVLAAPDYGAVFRCDPDGSNLEMFAVGLRNPQSLVFTENGDLFTGDNDCDAGDEERLVHVVENGDSGWRIGYQFAPLEKAGPWNTEKLWHQRHDGQPAYLIPPIANIEDGPSGITYYPGTGLNNSYAGSFFITHFKGAVAKSGIFTYNLKPKGASYEVGDSKPFLTSALPTDVKFGPDGKLYISDWAEGWPKSKKGRIYTIADPKVANDPVLKQTQAIIASDWTKKSLDELAQLLAHPDWRVRLEAQFTLAERGDSSLLVLARTATTASAHALARRHAIWGLGQLAAKNASALEPLRTLAKDADAEVRAQSFKVLGDAHPGANDLAAFVAALKDPSPRVKFFAAQGLAKTKLKAGDAALKDISPALLEALRANNNVDHTLRHAATVALANLGDLAALKAAMTDTSPAVRLGVVLAFRRLQQPEMAQFLKDSDPAIVREAALAINDAPIDAATPALAALIDQPKLSDEPVLFRALNAHFRLGQPANAGALAAYAARADAPAKLRAEALAQLALWGKPPQRDRIVGVFRPLADKSRDRDVAVNAIRPALLGLLAAGSPAVVQKAALAMWQALEIEGASDVLIALVRDNQQAGATRVAALNALDKLKDARLGEAVTAASASSSAPLRAAALPIAARLSPEASAPVLANLVTRGDVAEKKAAFVALGVLKHPSADQVLAEQLKLLAEGKVPVAAQLELVTAAGRRSDPAIKDLLAQREATIAASTDPLAPYRIALAGGDRTRGGRIFNTQPTLACIRCHRAGVDGGDAGPNLADIGARHTREQLLEAIVKPNATIAPGFDTIVVTLKSGGSAAGIVASETADTLTLRNSENKLVAVPKSDIAKREGAPSGMPEIYGTILTKSQLRDTVEFLFGLKENTPPLDANQPRALRGLPPAPKPTE